MALSDAMVEQLYVAPDWIGQGLGRRFIELAKDATPGRPGPVLLPGQRPARGGSTSGTASSAIAFGDGAGNEERQPDVRYAWRPDAAA